MHHTNKAFSVLFLLVAWFVTSFAIAQSDTQCQRVQDMTDAGTQYMVFHLLFKDAYLGLQEFNAQDHYLTMHMRHIFYPVLQPKLDKNCQNIRQINVSGFHHDEHSVLEKSGFFILTNKIYGDSNFGAEQCFVADIDFGNGIISKSKTFFPASWSREQTVRVIFEAFQNRIEEISIKNSSQKKFECRGFSNLIIDIIFDKENIIVSAYPSLKNFKI